MTHSAPVRHDGTDLLLQCYLQPRASRTGIVGEHDGALKIRISAPPVDGAANAELIRFLAALCGVSKQQVTIESGATGRRKRVRIRGCEAVPEALTTSGG